MGTIGRGDPSFVRDYRSRRNDGDYRERGEPPVCEGVSVGAAAAADDGVGPVRTAHAAPGQLGDLEAQQHRPHAAGPRRGATAAGGRGVLVVLVDAQRNEFSRRDIVLSLANKEGGAHVDHTIDEAYNNLRRNNAQGWMTVDGAGRETPAEDNVPATMRQIAYEILRTLDSNYRCNAPRDSEAGIIIRDMSVVSGNKPPEMGFPNLTKSRPVVAGRKIGRNDLCPCGSGKKYKKCCLR